MQFSISKNPAAFSVNGYDLQAKSVHSMAETLVAIKNVMNAYSDMVEKLSREMDVATARIEANKTKLINVAEQSQKFHLRRRNGVASGFSFQESSRFDGKFPNRFETIGKRPKHMQEACANLQKLPDFQSLHKFRDRLVTDKKDFSTSYSDPSFFVREKYENMREQYLQVSKKRKLDSKLQRKADPSKPPVVKKKQYKNDLGFYEDYSHKKVLFDAKPVITELSQPAQGFNSVESRGNSAAKFNLDTAADLDIEANLPVQKPDLVDDCQECFEINNAFPVENVLIVEETSSEIHSHVQSNSEEAVENCIEDNLVQIEETQDSCNNNERIKPPSPHEDMKPVQNGGCPPTRRDDEDDNLVQIEETQDNCNNNERIKPSSPHPDMTPVQNGGCPPTGRDDEDGKNNGRTKRNNPEPDIFDLIRKKKFTLKPPQVDEDSTAHKKGGCLPSGGNGEEDETKLTPLEAVMKAMAELRTKITQGGDTSIPKVSENAKCDEEDSEEVTW